MCAQLAFKAVSSSRRAAQFFASLQSASASLQGAACICCQHIVLDGTDFLTITLLSTQLTRTDLSSANISSAGSSFPTGRLKCLLPEV
jgi:hypothetical protein